MLSVIRDRTGHGFEVTGDAWATGTARAALTLAEGVHVTEDGRLIRSGAWSRHAPDGPGAPGVPCTDGPDVGIGSAWVPVAAGYGQPFMMHSGIIGGERIA